MFYGPLEQVSAALARLEVIADTYLSMNAPIQLAAPVLLEQRQSIQALLLDRVRANLSELDRGLTKQKTCSRLDVEGGWYAVLRVPVTQTVNFARAIIEMNQYRLAVRNLRFL